MHPLSTGARILPSLLLALLALLALLVAVAGAAPAPAAVPAVPALVQDDGEGEDGEDDGGADAAPGDGGAVDAAPGSLAGGGGFTVRVDAGACDTPDANAPAFDLTAAAPAGRGAAGDVFVSETEIAVPLADLLARPHAVAVDLDDAGLSVPVACGDVEGTVAGGRLVAGLLAADVGGLAGVVTLTETAGGAATLVSAYVILAGDAGAGGDRDGDDPAEEDGEGGEGGV